MKLRTSLMVAGILLSYAATALGALSHEEVAKLGTTLTPVGAEMAGNADGSIPPYEGGITSPIPGYKKGSGTRPDPFASEKPLFSIDAKSQGKYAAKLTEGTKALMEKQGFRIDVYKTHRTVAFPKFVLDGTRKVAATAKTKDNGLGLSGAVGGFPFPIPKTGHEAMWNHLVRYHGVFTLNERVRAYVVDASGRPTLVADATGTTELPFWNRKSSNHDVFFMFRSATKGPARRAGEGFIVKDSLDMVNQPRRAWQYLPGQRRVKLAPEIGYDTPNPTVNGMSTYDDGFLFSGLMDRYDFKLAGKKEMYIPYNCYKMVYHSNAEQLLKPHYFNPDLVRWELHRVWVVEANLKPGKRHLYARRIFYLDEDSWHILGSDAYDGRGQLYRTNFAYMVQNSDALAPNADTHSVYDLIAGSYGITVWPGTYGSVTYPASFPSSEWNPEAMAGTGR